MDIFDTATQQWPLPFPVNKKVPITEWMHAGMNRCKILYYV